MLTLIRYPLDGDKAHQVMPGRFVIPVVMEKDGLSRLGEPFLVKETAKGEDGRNHLASIVRGDFLSLVHGQYAVVDYAVRKMLEDNGPRTYHYLGEKCPLYYVTDDPTMIAALKNREIERDKRYVEMVRNLEHMMGAIAPCDAPGDRQINDYRKDVSVI